MAIPAGTLGLPQLGTKPSAPDVGTVIVYTKTDDVLYMQDSTGTEVPFGSSASMTNLTGDVSASGPGSAIATVNSVGGSSAANIHYAELAANAATPVNTASTIVKRDSSGNFSAGVITANLTGNVTGNVSGSSASFTGSLIGDVTGTQGATVVSMVGGYSALDIAASVAETQDATSVNTASTIVKRDASGNFVAGTITASFTGNLTGNVTGNVSGSSSTFTGSLSGDVSGTQSATSVDKIKGIAINPTAPTDAQFLVYNSTTVMYAAVSANGDVSMVNSGAMTVNSVGGSSATNIHSAELATNAATSLNTASTIVKRDSSGNFSAGTITATFSGNLTGNVTGNVSGSSGSFTGTLSGDVTGIQGATVVSAIQGTTVSGVTGTGNVVFSISPTITGTLIAAIANFSGAISAINFSGSSSGTNTGDVTTANTNSINLAFSSGQSGLNAILNLSAASADTGNVKATYSIKTDGLFIEIPFAAPVNIGTSNMSGAASSFALSDHVHAITSSVVTGLVLTGYTIGANTPIAATDMILTAFGKLQGQISATAGSAITALTGDFTATGPGSVPATITVGAVTDTKASLAVKPAVTVVATSNQTLSGTPTIDGQATSAGTSIVLLTAQSTTSQNGPWIVQSGAWTRPTWYPSGGTSQAFQFITTFVRLGTVYQGSVWRQTAADPIIIDTTATTWSVTPISGNYKSSFVVGPQTGSSTVQISFSNSLTGILAWNPGSNQTITLPPNLVGAGSYLSDTGGGILGWTNPLVNIDGGSPSSNYTSGQYINGGTP